MKFELNRINGITGSNDDFFAKVVIDTDISERQQVEMFEELLSSNGNKWALEILVRNHGKEEVLKLLEEWP